MISVRKFEEKDKQKLRQICLETSAFDLNKKNMKEFLLLMYNDYYTEKQGDVCFVAADENDEAVGYVICDKDYKTYKKVFMNEYYPKIKALGLKFALMARGELLVHDLAFGKYSAHLHINLTKACRRQGVGSKLIEALKAELKKQKTNSLMLSCGCTNKSAVAFYKKNGFHVLFNFFGSDLMVCKF